MTTDGLSFFGPLGDLDKAVADIINAPEPGEDGTLLDSLSEHGWQKKFNLAHRRYSAEKTLMYASHLVDKSLAQVRLLTTVCPTTLTYVNEHNSAANRALFSGILPTELFSSESYGFVCTESIFNTAWGHIMAAYEKLKEWFLSFLSFLGLRGKHGLNRKQTSFTKEAGASSFDLVKEAAVVIAHKKAFIKKWESYAKGSYTSVNNKKHFSAAIYNQLMDPTLVGNLTKDQLRTRSGPEIMQLLAKVPADPEHLLAMSWGKKITLLPTYPSVRAAVGNALTALQTTNPTEIKEGKCMLMEMSATDAGRIEVLGLSPTYPDGVLKFNNTNLISTMLTLSEVYATPSKNPPYNWLTINTSQGRGIHQISEEVYTNLLNTSDDINELLLALSKIIPPLIDDGIKLMDTVAANKDQAAAQAALASLTNIKNFLIAGYTIARKSVDMHYYFVDNVVVQLFEAWRSCIQFPDTTA